MKMLHLQRKERSSLKDVKKRTFLKKFVNFLPLAGFASVAFPAFELVSFRENAKQKVKIKISSIKFDINELNGFFLIKTKNSYKAFSRTCTHLGCSLKYDSLNQKFVCPCHKSEFSLNGEVLKSPAKEPMREVNVEKQDDFLVIKA